MIKQLNEKYAILKPDKGNGVVLIKMNDYDYLHSDACKSKIVTKDTTRTETSAIIGGVHLQIYFVLPDEFLLKTYMRKKEIRRAERTYEYVPHLFIASGFGSRNNFS